MKTKFLSTLAAATLAYPAFAQDSYPPLDVLVSSGETTIGQPFAYPEGSPNITGALVTMQPGQSTGWHFHEAPLFAYIMEGELQVDYGEAGVKRYGPGDAFIEAFGTPHNGSVVGDEPVRLLAVFAGAVNTPNTVTEQ